MMMYYNLVFFLTLAEQWITGDVRVGSEEENWLNMILRKESAKNIQL